MSDPLNDVVITTQDGLDASSDWSHLTYTWAVTELKTSTSGGHSRAVTQVYWSKTGTDNEGRSGVFRGATPLTAAPNLTPLAVSDARREQNDAKRDV